MSRGRVKLVCIAFFTMLRYTMVCGSRCANSSVAIVSKSAALENQSECNAHYRNADDNDENGSQ
eukprot:3276725-Amphidinium_carterae.1